MFENGPTKIYERQPLKILLGPFLNSLSQVYLIQALWTYFYKQWPILSISKCSSAKINKIKKLRTHFMLLAFNTLWIHQKTRGFLVFPRGYRKRPVTWNGLSCNYPVSYHIGFLIWTSTFSCTTKHEIRIKK